MSSISSRAASEYTVVSVTGLRLADSSGESVGSVGVVTVVDDWGFTVIVELFSSALSSLSIDLDGETGGECFKKESNFKLSESVCVLIKDPECVVDVVTVVVVTVVSGM